MNWWTLYGISRQRMEIRSVRNGTAWDQARVGAVTVRALIVTLVDGSELRVDPTQVAAFNAAVGRIGSQAL